jgi:hypothetical protein
MKLLGGKTKAVGNWSSREWLGLTSWRLLWTADYLLCTLIYLGKPDNLDFYRNTTNPWSVSSSQVWYLLSTNSNKVVQAALYAKHCSRHITCINAFNPHGNHGRQVLPPFVSICRKWNSEMLGNLTNVTQIGNGARQPSPELVLLTSVF